MLRGNSIPLISTNLGDGDQRRSTDKDPDEFEGSDVGHDGAELRSAVAASLRRVSAAISAGDAPTALAEVAAALLLLDRDDRPRLRAVK